MNQPLRQPDPPMPVSALHDLDMTRAKQIGFRVPSSLRPCRQRLRVTRDGQKGRPRKDAEA